MNDLLSIRQAILDEAHTDDRCPLFAGRSYRHADLLPTQELCRAYHDLTILAVVTAPSGSMPIVDLVRLLSLAELGRGWLDPDKNCINCGIYLAVDSGYVIINQSEAVEPTTRLRDIVTRYELLRLASHRTDD